MDFELISELKKCLDRYWRTIALPLEQRAPYAAGIVKLETRIEQLRAATGLDTVQFVRRVREALHQVHGVIIPMDAQGDDEFARIGEFLDRASVCFRMGDQQGTDTALSGLRAYCLEIAKTQKQEVLSL